MPCLLFLLALIAPRVVSVVLWLFTAFFQAAFAGRLWLLVLGILLMPFTTLVYAWAINSEGGVRGAGFVVLMVLAVLADLSALGSGRRWRRSA